MVSGQYKNILVLSINFYYPYTLKVSSFLGFSVCLEDGFQFIFEMPNSIIAIR